ncbi:MAG: hypothetical protein MUF49_25655 [Oculatellaceae cyanobacterium Prado106]|nr:hypothetical protein [Oculatellaceae cyanobacterium Prado106]
MGVANGAGLNNLDCCLWRIAPWIGFLNNSPNVWRDGSLDWLPGLAPWIASLDWLPGLPPWIGSLDDLPHV